MCPFKKTTYLRFPFTQEWPMRYEQWELLGETTGKLCNRALCKNVQRACTFFSFSLLPTQTAESGTQQPSWTMMWHWRQTAVLRTKPKERRSLGHWWHGRAANSLLVMESVCYGTLCVHGEKAICVCGVCVICEYVWHVCKVYGVWVCVVCVSSVCVRSVWDVCNGICMRGVWCVWERYVCL